jgi:macrolide transport system ATP-binding/permease protein
VIELHNIHKTYSVGDVDLAILKGITLAVDRGEYVALMGSSGSGKTTLMNLLGSLDHITGGEYRLSGVDVSGLTAEELATFRSRHIGFVFQNFNLLPRTSALDNVLLPTLYATDGRSRRERVEHAKQLLAMVGLGDRLDHTPNQLSGGERQRVAIARALINRPQLLLADEPTGNLDSRTEQEILGLFRDLNQQHGITLIVVTHDAAVAEQADRVVRMRDGVIAEDVPRPLRQERTSPATVESADGGPGQPNTGVPSLAAIVNAVTVAMLALRRNALRTVLTMLGVIIGVASVVTVMELSGGASFAIEETVASMGASSLIVTSSRGSAAGRRQREVRLTPDDAHAVVTACPAVQVAAPIVWARLQLVRGNRRWSPTFSLGTSPEYLQARNWSEFDIGQGFSQREINEAAKVCILGKTVADRLFENKYPIGLEIRANGVPLKVVGVLSGKGADVIGNDQDDILLAPWTTFKYRINQKMAPPQTVSTFSDRLPPMTLPANWQSIRNETVNQIYVTAHAPELVVKARQQITQLLSQRHHVPAADAFRISDMTEVSKVMDQVVAGLSALGLVIAGVSLLVGGVGIMNIMLVSVTERTREIGLRMAVGASQHAILRQFMIEATVLCLIGGAIGIFVGHVGSMALGAVIGWPTVMSVWAPLVAVSVAAVVGIVFGYYPARKASRLNPIDALRYE